jgi:thaumarchaeosortase
MMRVFSATSGTPITIILVAPILFTIFAYPNTFSLSWNQGHGGFLFAMAFIAAELFGVKPNINRKKLLQLQKIGQQT